MSSTGTIGLAVLTAALLAGCGGSSRKLGDGQWYGKLIAVDAADRRLDFAPACARSPAGRWTRVRDTGRREIVFAAHPQLEIYFRPGGSVEEGHGQFVSNLRELAGDAPGRPPDFPPGWFVSVQAGAVTAVAENSGLGESTSSWRRTFACVSSPWTRAFVK